MQVDPEQFMDIAPDGNASRIVNTPATEDHHILVQIDIVTQKRQRLTNENSRSV